MLFETWLFLAGKKSTVWPALAALRQGQPLTQSQCSQIWDTQSEHWYNFPLTALSSGELTLPFHTTRAAWVRVTLKNRSNKSTAALFHHTLTLDAHGLSRNGKDYLGNLGQCLLTVTFARLMRSRVALYWAALFSSLLHLPHAWWIDNYNKGFQKALAKLDTGSYLHIDGTCFVLVLLKQCPSASPPRSTSRQQQSTLPSEFSLGHLELFISSYDDNQPTNNLADSLAQALQVWNNPLRPPNACTPREFAAECLQGTPPSSYQFLILS